MARFGTSVNFENQLYTCIATARAWEDVEKRKKALTKVPLNDLEAIAQAKYDSSFPEQQIGISLEESRAIVRDLLILELLNWFKTEFFTWMNSPACPLCKTSTVSTGSTTPSAMEKSASVVELYKCPRGGCPGVARFPRFNDPAVLLDHRTGRCGEWANCFGLICRAAGYETRYVHDFTDHIWVEVFSSAMKPKNRWLHCDPCENTCDNPLLYEVGWGKKLTFVIAASIDDIQDVTWRYTHSKNLQQVLSRRNCDEKLVVQAILRARQQIQTSANSTRIQTLKQRLIEELIDFICPTVGKAKDSECHGRESGSLAWRLARQEVGQTDDDVQSPPPGYEWEIITNDQVTTPQLFEFAYDAVSDKYVTKSSHSTVEYSKSGWKNGAFQVKNMFRKEEPDWKMVYLARKDNGMNADGSVCWKFVIPDRLHSKGFKITNISLEMKTKTFHESAKIKLKLINDSNSEIVVPDDKCKEGIWKWSSSSACYGSKSVTIICDLSGGSGDQAWQHTQLFRESTSGTANNNSASKGLLKEPQFSVIINVSSLNDTH